ncbi:phosphatidylinositol transfer protein 1-like [Gossypium australe]|uniref:Phosphatidylinositol transfer protein 1-like n=1 Tax=Gossypium australe TaxID=47621 RepID=A0A5B6UP24_9ROSI|nr:phosphatidylinositol transfer protein 1-like [Gossypium australe]
MGTTRSRIVMPMSLEEYQVAQMYMVMKMQQQSTNGDEGVEVLENKRFQDDVFGEGQYTSKVYRLQSKAPAWLTTIAPKDALVMQEEAWNAYPRCKTGLQCPLGSILYPFFFLSLLDFIGASCINIYLSSVVYGMGLTFLSDQVLNCCSAHTLPSSLSQLRLSIGQIMAHRKMFLSTLKSNFGLALVLGLNEEQLAARQVEIIDIASAETDYWSYAIGSSSIDFSKFKSTKSGRGPLLDGWQDNCRPVMTAYKLVTIDAPYWGFGYRLEQALLAGERALFIESHRNCFGWIDEWFGLTMQQIRELEQQGDWLLNEKISKPVLLTDAADCEQRFIHSSERQVQQVVHS